jgi:ADP-heptose:LPS heptosyltransferase
VFIAAAAAAADASLFQRHIICSTYRDIATACDHRLEPIWLKLPWLPRDNSVGEPQYFSAALDRLGDAVVNENLIVFMRYSRGTGSSPFHRIDQDRFSLGDSIQESGQTVQERAPRHLSKCALPTAPLKVLFHITGGLPIKNYPFAFAKVVIRTLKALGVESTVIGRADLEAFGARSIEADETDLLAAAVEGHHIFVGLDSFPHHFVRNIMGWPTLGLFGTTSAANFGGGWHAHYQSLDAALPCHPCGGETSCPVFGYKECSNYIKPQQLVAAILTMAGQVYGYAA